MVTQSTGGGRFVGGEGGRSLVGRGALQRALGAALVWWSCSGALACGGAKPADYPAAPPATEEQPDPSWETEEPGGTSEPVEESAAAPEAKKKPVFTDGMGVDDAISAVPSDYEYIGIDQEVLAKPLTQLDTYKECKVKPSDKFKVRIAVWDGKVVGANVTSANKALAQCIDGVVRRLEYNDKVESINSVEYAF